MKLNRILVSALVLALPIAAACGGGGDNDDDDDSAPTSEATSSSSNGGGPSAADIADIDLCPMLTDEEVTEVASAPETRLGGEGSTYTVTRERIEYTAEQLRNFPQSSCRFVIDAGGALAVVQVVASSGHAYDTLYKPEGTPIAGIGDHAVFYRGSVLVKVGDLQLSIGEYTATSGFNAEILRRIAPDLQ